MTAWGTVTVEDLKPPTTASVLISFWRELTDSGLDAELVGRLMERACTAAVSQGLVVKDEK